MTIRFITSLKTPSHQPTRSHRPDTQEFRQRTQNHEHGNAHGLQRWENEGGRIVTKAWSEAAHPVNTHH